MHPQYLISLVAYFKVYCSKRAFYLISDEHLSSFCWEKKNCFKKYLYLKMIGITLLRILRGSLLRFHWMSGSLSSVVAVAALVPWKGHHYYPSWTITLLHDWTPLLPKGHRSLENQQIGQHFDKLFSILHQTLMNSHQGSAICQTFVFEGKEPGSPSTALKMQFQFDGPLQ